MRPGRYDKPNSSAGISSINTKIRPLVFITVLLTHESQAELSRVLLECLKVFEEEGREAMVK